MDSARVQWRSDALWSASASGLVILVVGVFAVASGQILLFPSLGRRPFALLAIQHVMLVAAPNWLESSAWLYLIRLAAFALLLIAILDKNRVARR